MVLRRSIQLSSLDWTTMRAVIIQHVVLQKQTAVP